MKKSFKALFLTLLMAGAVGAQAGSFETMAGASFTKYFTLTPTEDNSTFITVSGFDSQLSSLSFELSNGLTVASKSKNGYLVATFNDFKNELYNLTTGVGYTLKITGQTKPNPSGSTGYVSISNAYADVSPVPEPESYAMFLAGLGLMGAIARRRATKA